MKVYEKEIILLTVNLKLYKLNETFYKDKTSVGNTMTFSSVS